MSLGWYEDRQLAEEFEAAKRRARPAARLLSELFDDRPQAAAAGQAIPRYLHDRLFAAQRRRDQLLQELKVRRRLHTRFTREINRQIRYAAASLAQFTRWGVGYNTGVDVRRNHLERQLQQLRAERRTAHLTTWDDVVRIRKELREVVSDYRQAQRLLGAVQRPPSGDKGSSTDAR